MWAGESRWDKGSEPMGEINVTPLVDVMLVLLIIFMVTAPLLTQGVNVDLPKADAPSLRDNIEPLTVSVRADGRVFLQEHEITLEQLAARMQALHASKPDLSVFIRGDAKTPYERVAQVMGILAGAGIKKVSLVTEPVR